MRFASLGSGSHGNSTLIDDGETCVLVDLGFTVKEAERRLKRLGKAPADIDAILVTHEHGDHVHGVAPFARKHKRAVYMTPGTYVERKMGVVPDMKQINCHKPFLIGTLSIEPVAVPHDAKEPCQYVVSSNGFNVGVLTDLGHITVHVVQQYADCHGLLLECNHDTQMLEQGPYPYPLKQRVGGDHGHLNNNQAAELLQKINLGGLRHLVMSHISEKNNSPELAEKALLGVLEEWTGTLYTADQELGFDWIDLTV